jgi:hypothetical protein
LPVTEIVSSPRRARSSVKRVASATGMTSICSPSVSSEPSVSRTLASTCASWGRASSSQNTAGAPVARARSTARRTQSRIGASLVWHMRQMSPGSTVVLKERRAVGCDGADRARSLDLERLVVRAVLLGLLGHQPDVRGRAHRRGSKAPCSRQWSIVSAYSEA